MKPFANWAELLEEFRKIGGIAENITLATKGDVRGLYPVDPQNPVHLYIPEHALISVDDLKLKGSKIVVRSGSSVPKDVRWFYERYNMTTSWSKGGRQDIKQFLTDLESLPTPVKNVLHEDFGLESIIFGPDNLKIFKHFIASRSINYFDQTVVIPVIDLINHSPRGAPFLLNRGVAVKGKFSSEIYTYYSMADSWMKFCKYGFILPDRYAFSQCFSIETKDGKKNINVRDSIFDISKKEDDLIYPNVKIDGKSIDISFVIIGDRVDYSYPKRIFLSTIEKHLGKYTEELFETLVHINKTKFLKLLAACEGHNSTTVNMLRKLCRIQLEALSCCWFGNWP